MMKRTVIASCVLMLTATLTIADADAKLRNPFKKGEESSESQAEESKATPKEQGETRTVKGLNGWEGEIVGTPVANSKFTKLQIGMPSKQVTDLIGEPTDSGVYVTGKAFIPFFHGSDTSRMEYVYKGQGRLIFASRSSYGSGENLIKIIYNSQEEGYR